MSASLASLMYAFIGLPLLAVAGLNLAGRKLTRRVCRAVSRTSFRTSWARDVAAGSSAAAESTSSMRPFFRIPAQR